MRQILTPILGLMFAAVAAGQGAREPVAPNTPPPLLRIVNRVDANKQSIQFIVTEQVPRVVERVVTENRNIGGRLVPVQVKVNETVMTPVTRIVEESLRGISFQTLAGGPVPMRDLNRLLAGKVVAVAQNASGVDPIFRKALSADTIILIPSPQAAQLPSGVANPLPSSGTVPLPPGVIRFPSVGPKQ